MISALSLGRGQLRWLISEGPLALVVAAGLDLPARLEFHLQGDVCAWTRRASGLVMLMLIARSLDVHMFIHTSPTCVGFAQRVINRDEAIVNLWGALLRLLRRRACQFLPEDPVTQGLNAEMMHVMRVEFERAFSRGKLAKRLPCELAAGREGLKHLGHTPNAGFTARPKRRSRDRPAHRGLAARVDVESWAGGRMGSIAVTYNTHDAMLSRVLRLDEVLEAPRVGRKSASGREQRSRPPGLGINIRTGSVFTSPSTSARFGDLGCLASRRPTKSPPRRSFGTRDA